jgi:methionyl-tRNA formyltransferase
MKVVNVKVPPTLQSLSADELRQLAVHTILGRGGKEVLVEVLSARLDTKRKINHAASAVEPMDLATFALEIRHAGASIDFNKTYFLLTEPLRGLLTVKQ